jgi:Na+/H+-dicarboxylate symporter
MGDLALWGYWLTTAVLFALLFLMWRRSKMRLWARVLTGLVFGGIAGFIFGGGVAGCVDPDICAPASSKFIGDMFVRLIRMLVVPLIFTTLAAGVISMGDPKRLGSLGGKALGMYAITSLIAVAIGLVFGTLFRPGANMDLSNVAPGAVDDVRGKLDLAEGAGGLTERLVAIIPENPIAALASTDVLSIIFWALIFGVGVLMSGEVGKPVARVIESAAEAVLKVTEIVMELAPYGVYALIAWVISTQGLGILTSLGMLALTALLAFIVHAVFTYGAIIRGVTRLPVKRFYEGIVDAQAVAFSTASSNATLPVTIANVSDNLGVKKVVAGSVLPLGATINMDGTAIYLGIITLFASQALGISLSFADYLLVAITVTLASVGTAGIPSASLLLAATVFSVIGITSEQSVIIIALIFPFDRILDMMRTTVNVSGDAAVAVAVANWEGALDRDVFVAKSIQ